MTAQQKAARIYALELALKSLDLSAYMQRAKMQREVARLMFS